MIQMMQEEKEKLLAEVKEAIKMKKLSINSDECESGFENFIRK